MCYYSQQHSKDLLHFFFMTSWARCFSNSNQITFCPSKFWVWQIIKKPDAKKSHDFNSLYFLKPINASKMLSRQNSVTKSRIQPPMSLSSLLSLSYLLNVLSQNHVKADISRTLHHESPQFSLKSEKLHKPREAAQLTFHLGWSCSVLQLWCIWAIYIKQLIHQRIHY